LHRENRNGGEMAEAVGNTVIYYSGKIQFLGHTEVFPYKTPVLQINIAVT
jgi:hypothetical protein